MNNNQDKELVELIQSVKEGNAEKKELCNRIYKEVYALSYPVYKDEEKSMTQAKKALIEVCSKLDSINLDKNVHKQIAVIVSVYFLKCILNEEEEELKNYSSVREYNYSRIKEDEELLEYMKKKVSVFRSPKAFDEQEEIFKDLSPVKMVLLELFAYEMQSVETIEGMSDVDSTYIGSWIAEARAVVLGYEKADEVYAPIVQETEETEEYDDDAEYDDDTSEEYDDDYNHEYEEHKAVSSVYRGSKSKENAVTRFLAGLFPNMSLGARRIMSLIMGCVIVIALVAVLLASVTASTRKKSKSKEDYDYNNMQYYTRQATTKQSATEKTTERTTAGQTEMTTERTTAESTTADNRNTDETTQAVRDDNSRRNEETERETETQRNGLAADDDDSDGDDNKPDSDNNKPDSDNNKPDSDNNKPDSDNNNKPDSNNNNKPDSDNNNNKPDSDNNNSKPDSGNNNNKPADETNNSGDDSGEEGSLAAPTVSR